jgi:RNA-binding protein
MSAKPSNAVISKLKGLAQRLNAQLVLGKAGATDGFIQSLNAALAQHELVKIKFAAFKDERKTLAPQLAEKTGSHLVWIVGHVAVFYRQQPDPEKRTVAV